MAFTLNHINNLNNFGFIKQEKMDISNFTNGPEESLEDIFSDIHPLFDTDFFLEDDSLKLADENDLNNKDVVLSDKMMTEAAIRLPKAEPLIQDSDLRCSPSTGSAHSDDVSASEDSGTEEAGISSPTPASHVRPSSLQLPPPALPPRQAQKRHREDSTDALDHSPYSDEPVPSRRAAIDVSSYGRSVTVQGGCPSGRSMRSLIRPDALPGQQSGSRRPVQYVVRQSSSSGCGSVYIPGQGIQSMNNGRQILPRNRAATSEEHNRQKHYVGYGDSSTGSNTSSGGSSSNSAGYVLYPPTPPSSAHCSSDSDDGSCNGGYSYHHHGHGRHGHHHGGQLPLFQSPIPQSGELHLTEEERRTFIAEGFPIPCKLPLTKQEERALKKVRRKIKNKISAQESRRKKKEYLESLEKKIEQYSREYSEMKRRCESLEATNKSLLGQLRNLQGMLGKASSSTGTCLMVLVLCFAMLLGGGGYSERKSTQLTPFKSGGSTLPTLWAPEWRLGYRRPREEVAPRRVAKRPSAAVPVATTGQSRVLLGADDDHEHYTPYGPHLLWTTASGSGSCEVYTAPGSIHPATPQSTATGIKSNVSNHVTTYVTTAQPHLPPMNTTI